MKSLVLRGSFLVYLLVGLEILIMISPFAAYFYSAYSPVLNFMNSSPATRWVAEFFLPHFVFLDDFAMKAIGVVQITALAVGMFLFFYAAVPLYYFKFRQRGVVTGGIYVKIRHPQYLGLGIAGFGLLLYWPRFFILVMYLTMLFVYYILARSEERRMIAAYHDSYKTYMSKVPMFLPGDVGGRTFRFLFGHRSSKSSAIAVLYCLTVLLSVAGAMLLRQYSVNAIRLEEVKGLSVVSVLPDNKASARKIAETLLKEDAVKARMHNEETTLAYLMPADYFLMALVTDLPRLYPPDFEKPAGGNTVHRFVRIFLNYTRMQLGIYPEPQALKRIIFVSVRDEVGRPLRGKNAFRIGARRYAAFHVDMDTDSGRILSIQDVKPRHKWGEVAMPVF